MAFNGAIDWGSKLIKVTMHSSSEIEIAAACLAAKRLQFYRELSMELKIRVRVPLPMLIDNSGAIDLCERVGVSKRTEHTAKICATLLPTLSERPTYLFYVAHT